MFLRRFLLAGILTGCLAIAAPVPNRSVPDKLDLQQAIAFALENNLSIRQARERIRQQVGVVTTVSAAGLPTVSSAGSYQKSEVTAVVTGPGGFLFMPEGQFWRVNLTAAQTLFAGGGIRASIRGADLEREAAVLDFQATVNQALLDVRTRFYDVLLAREQIKVQEQNLELLEAQLKYANDRARAGTVSEFERLRAEVAVANAKAPLIRVRNDFRLAVEELRRVLGITNRESEALGEAPEVLGSLTFVSVSADLRAALDAAQANRPDLRRLSRLASAREEDIAVARSRYYPNLALSGGGELRKGRTNSFGDSLKGLRVGAQSQLEINRATSGRIAQASSRVEQARLTESEARLAAEVEVRTALFALEQASELVAAMRKTVGQAEEAVRLATMRFEAGVTTQLDLLQAQVELTTARTSQLSAFHGHNVAVARLRKAMGLAEVEYREITANGRVPPPVPMSMK